MGEEAAGDGPGVSNEESHTAWGPVARSDVESRCVLASAPRSPAASSASTSKVVVVVEPTALAMSSVSAPRPGCFRIEHKQDFALQKFGSV